MPVFACLLGFLFSFSETRCCRFQGKSANAYASKIITIYGFVWIFQFCNNVLFSFYQCMFYSLLMFGFKLQKMSAFTFF